MKTVLLFGLLYAPLGHSAAKNVGTSGGRFQLIQLSDMRRDQFLLDTETGRLWNGSCAVNIDGDCKLNYWEEENILGKNITMEKLTSMAAKIRKDHAEQNGASPSK